MSYANDVPTSVTQAGNDFNYAQWPVDSVIQLANVPWNNDYRDIVEFPTQKAFIDYIDERATHGIRLTRMAYAKFGQPISIDVPFNTANRYNYLLVKNDPYGHAGGSGDTIKYYPYFITGMEYVNPGTTRVYVQLDVYQMFGRSTTFGRGYVERGHIGIANSKQTEQNGRTYLTVPEGLDTGGEYVVNGIWSKKITTDPLPGYVTRNNASVIAVSSVDFEKSGGDVNDPKLVSAHGQYAGGIPSGADIYYFENPVHFFAFLLQNEDRPWVTQGIMAAYMIPPIKASDVVGQTFSGTNWTSKRITEYPQKTEMSMASGWRLKLKANIPARYKRLEKFLTYPYSFIQLTMHNGMPLVVKPESLPVNNDFVVQLYTMITPPNPRVMVAPKNYNTIAGSTSESDTITGEWLDFATGITNLPQIPVVNNMYASYLATNARSIEYQHRSADWSQTRALGAADTSYEQASGQIAANESMNAQSISAVNQSAQLSTETAGYTNMLGGAQQMIGGVTAGGIGGANPYAAGVGMASGAAGAVARTAISANQNRGQAAITNQLSSARTGTANAQAGLVRDTNLSYAQFASKGDYENSIAGINARVQDAAMIQPTVSGQVGGEAFNFSILRAYEVNAKVRQIDVNVMTMIGEYWLRYGYAVNRYHNLSMLNVMSKFTYWKVKELYIVSSLCPETYRQALRGIFEKGVTVWSDANDIATLDIGLNVPKAGISL